MNRIGIGLAAAAGLCLALSMAVLKSGGVHAEDPAAKKAEPAAAAPAAAPAAAAEAPAAAAPAAAAPAGEKKVEAGKWLLPDGTPTYNIDSETRGENTIIKKVDWYTYSGWRRYHANCHECHGPSGGGSSFAPALADSLKTIDYPTFLATVSGGRRREVAGTWFIMPALGDNPNVMCFIDDLYVYLKARADGAMPAGLLSADQRVEKPKEAIDRKSTRLNSSHRL